MSLIFWQAFIKPLVSFFVLGAAAIIAAGLNKIWPDSEMKRFLYEKHYTPIEREAEIARLLQQGHVQAADALREAGLTRSQRPSTKH